MSRLLLSARSDSITLAEDCARHVAESAPALYRFRALAARARALGLAIPSVAPEVEVDLECEAWADASVLAVALDRLIDLGMAEYAARVELATDREVEARCWAIGREIGPSPTVAVPTVDSLIRDATGEGE